MAEISEVSSIWFLDGEPVRRASPVFATLPLHGGSEQFCLHLHSKVVKYFYTWQVEVVQVASFGAIYYRHPFYEGCFTNNLTFWRMRACPRWNT